MVLVILSSVIDYPVNVYSRNCVLISSELSPNKACALYFQLLFQLAGRTMISEHK